MTGRRPDDSSEAGPPRLRVLVVDHRRAFAEALSERLVQEPDIAVVATAGSLEAAVDALDIARPTVGAVAIDLCGGRGLGLVTRARQSHPAVRWVVVGSGGEPPAPADALGAGASGYVSMDSSAAALADALRGAVAAPARSGPWSSSTTAPRLLR